MLGRAWSNVRVPGVFLHCSRPSVMVLVDCRAAWVKVELNFDTGNTTFKSVNWGRAGEKLSSGPNYRKDDIMRVAQQLLSRRSASTSHQRCSPAPTR